MAEVLLPCARLATDASATSLEAADLDSDLLLFRGSLGLQSRCSARHHAPLPEHHRPVASVFSQEEHQVGWLLVKHALQTPMDVPCWRARVAPQPRHVLQRPAVSPNLTC